MKALTLTQPWASLVMLGEKSVETRDWATAYRGPLLIHAAKGQTKAEREIRNEPMFHDALRRHGLEVSPLPMAAILGVVTLVDCVRVDSARWRDIQDQFDIREWFFGNLEPGQEPGRIAWLLANPRPIPRPVPWKGALGLWTAPDDWAGKNENIDRTFAEIERNRPGAV